MAAVGIYGLRADAPDNIFLKQYQRQSNHPAKRHDNNTEHCFFDYNRVKEAIETVRKNKAGGTGNKGRLNKGADRFGLAVTVAVLLI